MALIPSLDYFSSSGTADLNNTEGESLIPPLRYQCHGLDFPTWVSILTLCLAPLMIHLVSGTPKPSILTATRALRWHDLVCIYNPTSILWRYFAILNRRLRARTWTPVDMAASNALFWTETGWDGGEHMIERSRPYCGRLPRAPHVPLASPASLFTLITTVQGVQAAWIISGPVRDVVARVSLTTAFGPLAVFGLLRLSSALWLTDDYDFDVANLHRGYGPLPAAGTTTTIMHLPDPARNDPGAAARRIDIKDSVLININSSSISSATGLTVSSRTHPASAFRPASCWASRLLRLLYMGPLLLLLYNQGRLMCTVSQSPRLGSSTQHYGLRLRPQGSASTFAMGILFFFFFVVTVLTYGWHFVRGPCTSTVLPCMHRLWYKVYTGVVFLGLAAIFAVAAVETRQTPCGRYTVLPDVQPWRALVCPGQINIDPGSPMAPFGIAAPLLGQGTNGSVLESGVFGVVNVTGACLVKVSEDVWDNITSPHA